MRTLLLSPIILIFSFNSYNQVINGYAKITAITGTTLLTVNNVDETGDSFEDGDFAIVMQMQDDVIGANTADNASFGDLGAIGSAGNYEVVVIDSHTEGAGVPTTISLVNPLNQTYNIGANSSIQIITFPTFGTPDYTSTSDMIAKGWNGDVGGVVAFNVPGVLTLAHNVSADYAGFRGANLNAGGSVGCTGGSNYRVTTGNNHADKGEGIYKATNGNYAAGRAKILNGGGGGNSHNAGGGGGSNFSAGGIGGPGWPNCAPTAGGMGGIDLSAEISGMRIFMGGGGGSGEGNNGLAIGGRNGGGIVIIQADEIMTTCGGGVIVSADGESVLSGSGNDGNGGGGAAGTILFDINTWNLDPGCPLTINNNGGDGGDVNHGGFHGGGGGGGLGPVIFTTAVPTTNVTINNGPGDGGENCTGCASTDGGSGANGDGVISLTTTPLPVELVDFKVTLNSNLKVDITWTTKSEINNDYFVVERSFNGEIWEKIVKFYGAGNSSEELNYYTLDGNPFSGLSYYRLKQVDFDGSSTYSDLRSVKVERAESHIKVYPNPTANQLIIESENLSTERVKIYNTLGQNMSANYHYIEIGTDKLELNVSALPSGVYYIVVNSEVIRFTKS